MRRSQLFSNEIPPACQYCKYGFITRSGETVLCEKRGATAPHASCRRYRYAPLKRVPKRPNALPAFDPSDFKL